MLKILYLHTLMIDTLLKTIPEVNQTLLQFIDVMNMVDLLLHFSPSVSSNDAGDKWRKRVCVDIRLKV